MQQQSMLQDSQSSQDDEKEKKERIDQSEKTPMPSAVEEYALKFKNSIKEQCELAFMFDRCCSYQVRCKNCV